MAALVALPLALLSAQGGVPLAAGVNPLTYSRGFLVTGNYVAAGMRSAAGYIQIAGIEKDSDIVGAYLFFETIHSASDEHPEDMARFDGKPLPRVNLQARSYSLAGNTATCWGVASKISQPTLTMYRADVLPLLRKRMDKDDNWTGKYHVNNLYFVALPDGFNGNNAVQSGGATLVIVYKNLAEPLRKITFFDGVYPKLETTDLNQTLAGFYKSAGTLARMTHLVGAGGSNTSDKLFFRNGAQEVAIAADPFTVRSGAGRTWNTVTFNLGAGPLANATKMPGLPNNPAANLGEYVTTRASHTSTKRECLAWGAIIFSAQVADNDPTQITGGRIGDGLPDGLEDATNGLKDPNGVQLPNLNAMGASSAHQDLFVELHAMWTKPVNGVSTVPITYGTHQYETTDLDGHSHILSPPNTAALAAMYAAKGIKAHFDAGDPQTYRDRYVAECGKTKSALQCQDEMDDADPYLVDVEWARGGEMIQEKACSNPDPSKCQFPAWPGTVGWPLGAQLLRDAPVGDNGEELAVTNSNGTPHADLVNWVNGAEHRRRFDLERRDYFRLLLSAHGRGKARSQFPCLDVSDPLDPLPTDYNSANQSCAAPLVANPDFHNIRSLSGIAHLGGNLALKTLGLWDDFTGTEFVQGSTAAHELGHLFYLWHGGLPAIFGDGTANPPTPSVIEPNCKPNYLSSMSYSVQAIGLRDNFGNPYFDYSGERHADINEGALLDGALMPSTNLYRPTWFVELVPVQNPGGPSLPPVLFNPLAASQGAPPATRFCSGQRFDPSAPPPRARVEANLISDTIDWDGGGPMTVPDVNFDGAITALKGFNDWANLRLDQIGGGRDFTLVRSLTAAGGNELVVDAGSGGELMLDVASGGELAVDLGSGIELMVDAGSGGELLAELGSGGELLADAGSGGELFLEVGSGGELLAELGSGGELFLELGSGGELFLELGGGAEMLIEARVGGEAELTYEGALAFGRAAPQTLAACVIGVNCPESAPGAPLHRTSLTWKRPTFGKVAFYRVYRRLVGQVQYIEISGPGSPGTSFVDQEELPNGQQFEYVVRAQFDDGVISRSSNIALITATNVAPVAVADAAVTNEDSPVDIDVVSNDTDADTADPNPATAANEGIKVSAITNAHGGTAVLLPDGRVRFTPILNANNGNTEGGFGFTYRANNGTWSRAPNPLLSPDSSDVTVEVSVVSVNDAPAGTNNAVITVEDTPKAFAASDFGFTDPADTPANALSRVRIVSVPTAGRLRLFDGIEGSAVLAAGAIVTKAEIDAGRLFFEPAAGGSGIPYATFPFQVQDDGGTALGGVDLDPSPNIMTIHVISFVPTTFANCATDDTPEVTVSGNLVTMGVPREDTEMDSCIHGASALLPALSAGKTKYRVTFTYNLYSWDAYNADTAADGDGYWDSFSVSVSNAPYQNLGLGDPITTSNLPGLGFLWGGTNFFDDLLECKPSNNATNFSCGGSPRSFTAVPAAQTSVDMPGTAGSNYLNVVLDTITEPDSNHNHPSYGRIRILSIVQVP